MLDQPAWLRFAPAVFLLLWASGFVFLKVGLQYADPLTFLALRYACVIGLLLLPALWFRPPLPDRPSVWFHLAMVGLLLQAGYFSFTYLSLKAGMSAGVIALITSQQPILVGLLAPVIAGEHVPLSRWVGLALGVAGAAIVIVSQSSIHIASRLALLFGVAALLSLTGGTLWEKRFGTAVHPITANLVQYAVGLLVTASLAYTLEPMHVDWTVELFGSLAYLVIGNSLVAISLLLAMYRYGEASRVSALFFLVPPATALIAFAVLHERIAPLAWLGMLLAAIGLYWVLNVRERNENQEGHKRDQA